MNEKRCYGCMAPSPGAAFCPQCGYPAGKENEPHQLRPGTLLQEKYMIGKVLGQGGFGITYLGWDREREEAIAVKEYYPSSLVTRDTARGDRVHCYTGSLSEAYLSSKARFLREAQALSRLENVPSIVKIRDCFELNETAYIVMEYVKGSNLYSYISMRGGRLGFGETMNILMPIMDALASVHSMGLIHRDLSPDNIMLHPTRGAVLLDFGAVRDVTGADAATPLMKSTEAILKHGFAPVEQYRTRGSLGPWTDVYALCATIYYSLTGTVPPDAVARLLGEEQLDWAAVPGLNDAQRKVLDKGMAINAPQRYASVGDFLQDLTAVSRPTPQVNTPEVPDDKPDNGKKKRLALILGIGAALIGLSFCIRLLLPAAETSTEREPPKMSDSVYASRPEEDSSPDEFTLPDWEPYLTAPTEASTEPSETTAPPLEEEPPEPDDITAPKAEGAAEMVNYRSVYYSLTYELSTIGADCTWNLDPITIAFSPRLNFTKDNTEVVIQDSSGNSIPNPGFRFTWEGNNVYVDLPESLPHGVYHIIIRKDGESVDYVICSGEDGKYYPIDPAGNLYDAGLEHQQTKLLLVRGKDGFSMTRDEEKKSRFSDPQDICCVEYRNGVPCPTVSGTPAKLELVEHCQFNYGHMYLIRMDGWYLAYSADLGLYFTKNLDSNCHWSISW